jgi:hypothetical protein
LFRIHRVAISDYSRFENSLQFFIIVSHTPRRYVGL